MKLNNWNIDELENIFIRELEELKHWINYDSLNSELEHKLSMNYVEDKYAICLTHLIQI